LKLRKGAQVNLGNFRGGIPIRRGKESPWPRAKRPRLGGGILDECRGGGFRRKRNNLLRGKEDKVGREKERSQKQHRGREIILWFSAKVQSRSAKVGGFTPKKKGKTSSRKMRRG